MGKVKQRRNFYNKMEVYLAGKKPLKIENFSIYYENDNTLKCILYKLLVHVSLQKHATFEFDPEKKLYYSVEKDNFSEERGYIKAPIYTDPKHVYRSFEELFRLLKYHYSTQKPITVKDVYDTLIFLVNNGFIHSWICKNIAKRVYYGGEKKRIYFFNSQKTDEFGFNFGGITAPSNYVEYGNETNETHLSYIQI